MRRQMPTLRFKILWARRLSFMQSLPDGDCISGEAQGEKKSDDQIS